MGWGDKFLDAVHELPTDWTMIRLGMDADPGDRSPDDRIPGTHWFPVHRTSDHKYSGLPGIILDKGRAEYQFNMVHNESSFPADNHSALPGMHLYEHNIIDRVEFETTLWTNDPCKQS